MPPKLKTMTEKTAEVMKAVNEQLEKAAESMTSRIEEARQKVENHRPRHRRTNPNLEPVR